MTTSASSNSYIPNQVFIIKNWNRVAEAILDKIPTVEAAIVDKMRGLHIELANRVALEKLSGDPLHERSGNLKNSVIASPETWVDGDLIKSHVGSDLIYSRIHELGGEIVPVNAQYLTFKTAEGNWVRTKHVTMPKRPYLAPTLEEMVPDIQTGLEDAIMEALRA